MMPFETFSDIYGTPDDMTPEMAIAFLNIMKEEYSEELTNLKELFGDLETEHLESPASILDSMQAMFCRALEMGIEALRKEHEQEN